LKYAIFVSPYKKRGSYVEDSLNSFSAAPSNGMWGVLDFKTCFFFLKQAVLRTCTLACPGTPPRVAGFMLTKGLRIREKICMGGNKEMNKQNLLLASLIGGIINIILSNTPFLNLINLLLCAGFWIGAIIAVWIYKSREGSVTIRQGTLIGVITGVWAGIFGIALSFVGLAGASALAGSISQFIPADSSAELRDLLKGPGEMLFNICGVGVDIIFGTLGGLIGGLFFRNKRVASVNN
jgi:hypothetical protein